MGYYQNSSYHPSGRYRKKPSDGLPHVFLYYILPFLAFNAILFFCVTSRPKITLEVEDTKDYVATQATMTIESWFPTKSVALNMDGEILEAVKGKKRTYAVNITRNGVLEATVVNLNGMSTTIFHHVNILDDNPPTFENATLEDGVLNLRVSDSQSMINPESIYALDSNNQMQHPASVNRMENAADNGAIYEVAFSMDNQGLYVYIQDKAGNEARKSFTTHKEGNLDVLEVGADQEEGAETGGGTDPAAMGGIPADQGSAGEAGPAPSDGESHPETEGGMPQIVIE